MEEWRIPAIVRIAEELQSAFEEVHRLEDKLGDQVVRCADAIRKVQLRVAEAQDELESHKQTIVELEREIVRLKARILELEGQKER